LMIRIWRPAQPGDDIDSSIGDEKIQPPSLS